MNAMTCTDAQAQLDLLSADECDPPTRMALEGHLRDCPSCAARYAESQRLLGLLDLHWNDQAVERLQQRIDQQARPAQRFYMPLVRRTFAIAALVLIAAGLIWWLPNRHFDQKRSTPAFALLVLARDPIAAPAKDNLAAPARDKVAEAMVIRLAERGGKEFRADLAKAQQEGKLPLPPVVSLDLVLVNTSERTVVVRLGDILELEMPGDGVVRIAAPQATEPEFLRPRAIQLDPGKQHVIHIDRLIAGSQGKLEYIYITEPGEYMLTARVRLFADGKVVTVAGAPVRIKVGN